MNEFKLTVANITVSRKNGDEFESDNFKSARIITSRFYIFNFYYKYTN